MKLEHIALTINNNDEIVDFYHNVLGMKTARAFTLNSELSDTIFKIIKDVHVYLLKKGNLFFEIFISPEKKSHGYDHVCISVTSREKMIQNAVKANYEVIQIERENSDLVFIKDKSNNIFEIKEM
jgi:catechol 2,3-dioxygenase-like lactoylglutathione lyase family enzyme